MVFDDIANFTDEEIQMILNETDRKHWEVGLKGGSKELQDRICGVVGEEEAPAMKKGMDYSGPTKMSKVEYVQITIVQKVLQLEQDGKLEIPREKDPFV